MSDEHVRVTPAGANEYMVRIGHSDSGDSMEFTFRVDDDVLPLVVCPREYYVWTGRRAPSRQLVSLILKLHQARRPAG